MTVIVKHNKTNTITDWTQAQLDEQIALGNFAPGTTLANIVLPSDWNNDHTLTGLGTMAEQDATAVAITGGTINNTTIGATTATTGKFTSVTTPSVTATTLDLALNSASTGSVNFSNAGGQLFKISDGGAYGGYWNAFSASGSPSLRAIGNVSGAIDTNSAVPIQFRTNLGSSGAEQFRVGHTASAVNYVQVTGAATGGFVAISAQGSDSNPGIYYTTKGFGSHRFTTNTGGGSEQFRIITNSASTVNFLQVNGSATTLAPQFSAQGTDTNISMAFQPKGTGAIDLAAGSSGVNISNGGTVTAITRTAGGSGYATAPTVAISAPTTAGGVQATATCTVTAGAVNTTFTITNAGSGYIEQPTITFSGGGGSGAAAYATVGSGTTVKSLNGTMSFNTPAGESVRINNGGFSTLTDYVELRGGSSVSGAYVTVGGSTANASLYLSSKASSNIQFYTNSFNQEQFRVSHTASAVNYVQVTGAATSGTPTISAQGSDANVSITIASKNVADARLQSNGGNVALLTDSGLTALRAIPRVASGDTFLDVQRAVGFIDLIASSSVTDGDIRFTPKGAGNVRFGTYTAGVLTPTGYVTIKDSGGTSRRLLVG
jgi:hypothetical protein